MQNTSPNTTTPVRADSTPAQKPLYHAGFAAQIRDCKDACHACELSRIYAEEAETRFNARSKAMHNQIADAFIERAAEIEASENSMPAPVYLAVIIELLPVIPKCGFRYFLGTNGHKTESFDFAQRFETPESAMEAARANAQTPEQAGYALFNQDKAKDSSASGPWVWPTQRETI